MACNIVVFVLQRYNMDLVDHNVGREPLTDFTNGINGGIELLLLVEPLEANLQILCIFS